MSNYQQINSENGLTGAINEQKQLILAHKSYYFNHILHKYASIKSKMPEMYFYRAKMDRFRSHGNYDNHKQEAGAMTGSVFFLNQSREANLLLFINI